MAFHEARYHYCAFAAHGVAARSFEMPIAVAIPLDAYEGVPRQRLIDFVFTHQFTFLMRDSKWHSRRAWFLAIYGCGFIQANVVGAMASAATCSAGDHLPSRGRSGSRRRR